MEKELERLRDFVLDRREYCVRYRVRNYDPIFEEAMLNYSMAPKGSVAGTDLTMPEVFVRTEILLANQLADFMNYKLSPLQAFRVQGTSSQPCDELRIFWEQRAREMKFVPKMVPFFRQANLLGTSVVSLIWRYHFGWKTRRLPKVEGEEEMGTRTLHFAELLHSGAELTVLDLLSCWFDPDAPSCAMEDCLDFGIDRWVTEQELQELVAIGQCSPSVLDTDWNKVQQRYEMGGQETFSLDRRKEIMGIETAVPQPEERRAREVLLTEWWGSYLVPKQKFAAPFVVMVVDPYGEKVLGCPFETPLQPWGNHPYDHGKKPFIAMNLTPRDFDPYGIGLWESMGPLIAENHENVNLRMKNIGLSAVGMKGIVHGALVNPEDTLIFPGKIWQFRTAIKDNLKDITWPSAAGDISAVIAEGRQYMDEVSGVDALMRQGAPSSGAKTPISATESNTRQQLASRRLNFSLGLMMLQGPVGIAQMWLELERQYINEPLSVMALNKSVDSGPITAKRTEITPDILREDYNFFFVGDPLRVNENVERNQRITTLGLFTNPVFYAQAPPSAVVRPWVLAKLMCSAAEIPWEELLIPEESAIQHEVDSISAEAGAQAAMLAGGPGMQQPGQQEEEQVQPQAGSIGLPAIAPTTTGEGAELPPVPGGISPTGQSPIPEDGGMVS